MTNWGKWPVVETLVAALLLVVVLMWRLAREMAVFSGPLLLLAIVGCGDSGTHHVPRPGEMRVRALVVRGPASLRLHERDWIEESVEAYLAAVDVHRHPSLRAAGFYPVRVHVYRTDAEVNKARYGLQGAQVFSYSGTGFQTAEAPNGFLHGNELHVYGGSKWQCPGLAHMFWHVYEGYAVTDHTDTRLSGLNASGGVVNNYLWAKR